jgi:hypothetical protein
MGQGPTTRSPKPVRAQHYQLANKHAKPPSRPLQPHIQAEGAGQAEATVSAEASNGKVSCIASSMAKTSGTPPRTCLVTKDARDRMARTVSNNNPRAIAHTYQPYCPPRYIKTYNHPSPNITKTTTNTKKNFPHHLPTKKSFPSHPTTNNSPTHQLHRPPPNEEEGFIQPSVQGIIHIISGGPSMNFESKQQKKKTTIYG